MLALLPFFAVVLFPSPVHVWLLNASLNTYINVQMVDF